MWAYKTPYFDKRFVLAIAYPGSASLSDFLKKGFTVVNASKSDHVLMS